MSSASTGRERCEMILGIDHVGIAVRDAGEASATFVRLLGHSATNVETLPEQQVRVCFVPVPAPNLEVLSPAPPAQGGDAASSPVGRFLARRGEGMHHVCFAVDNIQAEMRRLAADGFALIDGAPRRGHGGLVAFLHPRGTHGVLIELLQRDANGHTAEGEHGG